MRFCFLNLQSIYPYTWQNILRKMPFLTFCPSRLQKGVFRPPRGCCPKTFSGASPRPLFMRTSFTCPPHLLLAGTNSDLLASKQVKLIFQRRLGFWQLMWHKAATSRLKRFPTDVKWMTNQENVSPLDLFFRKVNT